MKNIDQDFNTLQDYIDDKLSEQEARKIRQRLDKEPELAQLHKRSKAAIEVVKADSERSTMALLKSIQVSETSHLDVNKPSAKVVKIKPFRLISIAAALIALVLVSVWVFQPKNQNLSAFNEYYETPVIDIQRGGEQTDEALLRAVSSYNDGNFSDFLKDIDLYKNSTTLSTQLRIHKAVAYLETNQTSTAIEILEDLSQGKEQLDQVLWLKALAYLKTGEKENAQEALKALQSEEILTTPGRQQQVSELLRKLD